VDEGDIIWDDEVAADVPSGSVDDQSGMSAGGDGTADLVEHEVHGLCVGPGHDDGGTGVTVWADGTKDVG